ncbi:MAG: 50S ribosomal protein L15 [Micrococcales bacterium]|nr:50S ribosomal protein L15 [Micrococcales bacterium]
MAEEKDEATKPAPKAAKAEAPAKADAPAKAAAPKKATAAKAEPKKAAAPKAAPAKAEASDAPAKKATTKAASTKAAAAKATPEKAESEKAEPAAAKATASKAAPAKAKKPAASKAKAEASEKAVATQGHGGTLRVHHLRPAPGAHKPKIRVGRGEGSKGKTAGRGTKGSKARNQIPARFEGGQTPLHMRLPKLRGFRSPFRVEYQVVNLDKLAALYPAGGEVTVTDLVAKGAVRKGAPVKVLGTGEISVKLTVSVDALSASAREKILAAGGTVAND